MLLSLRLGAKAGCSAVAIANREPNGLHSFTLPRFFPSMVYLSSSKISLAVLGNMGFALALATYKLLLRVRRRHCCSRCLVALCLLQWQLAAAPQLVVPLSHVECTSGQLSRPGLTSAVGKCPRSSASMLPSTGLARSSSIPAHPRTSMVCLATGASNQVFS